MINLDSYLNLVNVILHDCQVSRESSSSGWLDSIAMCCQISKAINFFGSHLKIWIFGKLNNCCVLVVILFPPLVGWIPFQATTISPWPYPLEYALIILALAVPMPRLAREGIDIIRDRFNVRTKFLCLWISNLVMQFENDNTR